MITLFYDGTSKDITPLDTSYRYRSLMGENTLTLIFEDADFIEIPLGAYCDFEGERYILLKPENFKKEGSRKYIYTLILDGPQGGLRKYKIRDAVDKQLKFSLTAKPQEHLQLLVDNLNERETGWVVGDYIDAPEKVISYNHTSLDAALQQIAEAFETEWEIQGKTIHLRKVEYNKSAPLALSYGKGNGFLPGVGRANSEETNAVEILFVQGGTRNINYSDYGSRELRLPKSASMNYEGRQYVTDSLGMYITRGDKAPETRTEDSIDCSHIYPSRVGEVSEVEVVNADNHLYDFFDTSIPEDLDFKACLIAGQSLTVKFETGILAGREFDVNYKHAEKRFLLVPQEMDGVTMPNAIFQPSIGDKYAVFGMQMPSQYISDDTTQTGASWDMFREGVRYLYEHENPRFSFTGEMDGIWSKQNWLNVGGKIVLGGYVLFSDPAFKPDGINIRIVGIRQPLNNPHAPVIELSNAPSGVSVASELKKIKQNEVVVDDKVGEVHSYAKRRYRESQETIEMLSEAVTGFTNGVNPLSVKTMSLIVGSEALQFRFVDSQTTPTEIVHSITFDSSSKVLSADAGTVQHMTIGINTLISGGRSADEYTFWDVTAFDSPPLTDPSKRYYLYIKASKADSTAEFYLSETPIGMEEESGFYDFLVGFLNSESDGERSFARMHGFTEVLPGRISTSKIHADTVEATQVLAEEIYASGAQIGGIDISPDDLITGLNGIRLGTAKRFGPYTGEAGILLGVDNSGGSQIYKAFIGNSQSYLHYDGTDLVISQNAKIIGGTTFKDISDISRYLKIGGDPGAEYLYSELPIASAGDITAYSETAFVSTIWESMPMASATLLGGVKVGEGINVDSNGVISVDSTSLSPQTLGLSGNVLSISGGNSVDLSGLSPDLTGYATESWVTSQFEPLFTKNTAFNKNFGTIAGTVVQGNDSRLTIAYSHSQITTGNPHNISLADIGESLSSINYWTKSGSDLYYNSGNVGVGSTTFDSGVDGLQISSAVSKFGFLVRRNTGSRIAGVYTDADGDGSLFLYDKSENSNVLLNTNGDSYFNGGNLGIKKTNPTYDLDVNGTGRFGSGGVIVDEGVGRELQLRDEQILFTRDNANYIKASSTGGYMAFITNGRGTSVGDASLVLSPYATYFQNLNVGIGTTSPESWAKLHTYLTTSGDGVYIQNSNPTENINSVFRIDAAAGKTNALRVQRDGKIGINKTTADYTLDVNGTGRFSGDLIVKGTFRPSTNTWHTSTDGNPRLYFGTDSHTYLRTASHIYFRNAANSTIASMYDDGNMSVEGTFTASGSIIANTYFRSSDNAVVLGTSGSGGVIYLRPNGYGSTDHSAILNSQGEFSVRESGGGTNLSEIFLSPGKGSSGSGQISITDNEDMSWALGGDDGDNNFKIHGVASSIIPTIYGLSNPLFELTTTGELRVAGDIVAYA